MSGTVLSVLLLSLLSIVSSPHVVTINSPNPQPFGSFGMSVDSANGLVVVGAPYELANASATRVSGLVYEFDAETGSLIRTLSSPHPYCAIRGGCAFGFSVQLADRYLIVGAPGETVNETEGAGEIFVFNSRNGELLHSFVSPNPQLGGFFGARFAQENDRVFVSASIESNAGLYAAGQVYVFNIRTWAWMTTLVSPNPHFDGFFGIALAVSDDRLVVGAEGEGPPGCNPPFCIDIQGRAYVFNATSGSLITTLLPTYQPPSYQSALFGNSVAIQNQLAFVGADAEMVDGRFDAGRVYVYNATTGSVIRTLVSPAQGMEGLFGVSLALAGDDILIGASNEMVDGHYAAGRVYVFDPTTGTFIGTIVSPNPSDSAAFGISIDVNKGRVFVGAPYETVQGEYSAGSAYIFRGIIDNAHSGLDEGQP